jgi:hypothetical protein
MTTATRQLDIKHEAENIQFGRMTATAITALFVAIGWLAGAAWWAIRYCAMAVRYGYRQGARIPRTQELTKQ